jgi:DKNYY family
MARSEAKLQGCLVAASLGVTDGGDSEHMARALTGSASCLVAKARVAFLLGAITLFAPFLCVSAQAPSPATIGMSKYTDSKFGFSFWYPSSWTLAAQTPNQIDSFRHGRFVEQLSVNNPHPPSDSSYGAIGVQIAVFHSSDKSITELGATNSASPVGTDMKYFLDPKTHAWMLTLLKDDTGSFQARATMRADAADKFFSPGTPTKTMGGLPVFPGAARHSADSIVPLGEGNFVIVSTDDPGGRTNQNYLADTIAAADPRAGIPVSDEAQRETIQREALVYTATGTVIQTPTAIWFKDSGHVYDHDGNLLPDADPTTFAALSQTGMSSNFATDGVHMYEEDGEIPGADPATFKVLDLNFEKDASHVFLRNKAIPGADASTFVMTGPDLGKDSRHVYDFRDGNLKIDGKAVQQ